MTVRYYSRTPGDPAAVAALGAERVAKLVDLAGAADVVSLHVPGGSPTRHMIGVEFLAAMKRGAILVNTARGPVVDEQALVDALDRGAIAAAALDVYEREPVVHPGLLNHARSVLLPHLGSATVETRTAMGRQAVTNIAAFVAGTELPNRVA